MVLRVVRHRLFDSDFFALPPTVQDEFWRVLNGLRRRPFASGIGYTVRPLRRTTRSGVRVAHFHEDRYRLLFEGDEPLLILVGAGPRPGFYRRLERLRGRPRLSES